MNYRLQSWKRREMGTKGIRLLLFIFFSHLCIVLALSSSTLHQEHSSSDFMQDKNSRGRSAYEQSSNGIYGSDTGKYTIEHSNKLEHGIGHGTAGGGGARATNPGETNGGTRTPSTQGGTTFIPVYAAGAANNRHPYHRGAASSKQIGVYTLIAATMATILHLYGVFRCG